MSSEFEPQSPKKQPQEGYVEPVWNSSIPSLTEREEHNQEVAKLKKDIHDLEEWAGKSLLGKIGGILTKPTVKNTYTDEDMHRRLRHLEEDPRFKEAN